MKEIQYKSFSWNSHKKNWLLKKPNVCQFEITFKCDLHCRHCYADCYNNPYYIKKELSIKEVKLILGKVYSSGVIWLCFTGGDPLTRDDFLDIYSYAKNKGFIITIFTNGYSMTKKIADYLKDRPPFVIEITLDAVREKSYERITNVRGSFKKTMEGLDLILERKLPLKIKTEVIKDNLEELPKIKEFVEHLGLNFRPFPFLHARLNGDLTPCSLRIKPEEVARLNKELQVAHNMPHVTSNRLQVKPYVEKDDTCYMRRDTCNSMSNNDLFNCAIGSGDGIYIDPFGNLIPCICIRKPKINSIRNFTQEDSNSTISNGVNLLEESIEKARENILKWLRGRKFISDSKCKNCSIRDLCYSCPGKAFLERGNWEEPIEWFCKLAHLTCKKTTAKLSNC